MTSGQDSAENYCYRHPNRQSFVLCQRCTRTICPECQVQAAVGVHCVECVKANRPARSTPTVARVLRSSNAPIVTYSLIGLTVFVYLLQLIPALGVTQRLLYAPVFTGAVSGFPLEPWRMLSYAFVHSPFSLGAPTAIFHILLNMISLYIFGRVLEPAIGRWWFLTIYLLSAVGGAVAVDVISPVDQSVVGASGAIFGLMGAFFIIARKLGGNTAQLVVLVVLNLAIGFFVPGIAWQAHIGGLVVGLLLGFVFAQTRKANQKTTQIALSVAVFGGLVIVTVARALI